MFSDGSLTQAEIDALLQSSDEVAVTEEVGDHSQGGVDSTLRDFNRLGEETLDALRTELRSLLNSTSSIINRENSIITDLGHIKPLLGDHGVQVVRTVSGMASDITYLMSSDAARTFAGTIMNQSNLELDSAVFNALQEAFAQLSEPLLTAIGNQTGSPVAISATEARETSILEANIPADPFILNCYQIDLGTGESLNYYELFDPVFLERISGADSTQEAPIPQKIEMPVLAGAAIAAPKSSTPSPAPSGKSIFPSAPSRSVVQPTHLRDLPKDSSASADGNLGLLMDVNMEMTVELGRTKKLVKDILVMGQGSIIELDKLAGEPVDILVNHRLIAKGEVVVIDENFGVRVTEIVSPYERI